MKKIEKLYSVGSCVPVYEGHKDVDFTWTVKGRDRPVAPFEELIENYPGINGDKYYAEECARELFTWDELQIFIQYLEKHTYITVDYSEIKLPYDCGDLAPSEMLMVTSLGGGLILTLPDEYNFPFKIEGFYDLGYHEKSEIAGDGHYCQVEADYLNGCPLSIHVSPADASSVYPTHSHGLNYIGLPELVIAATEYGPEFNSNRLLAIYASLANPQNEAKLSILVNGATIEFTTRDLLPDKEVPDEVNYLYMMKKVPATADIVVEAYGELVDSGIEYAHTWVVQV